jgi:hypothetical protein
MLYNRSVMRDQLLVLAEDYLKEHPEVKELLQQFNLSWEQYQRFLAMIPPPQIQSSTTPTNQGSLNVDLSRPAR